MARCNAATLIIVCLTWPNLAFHICQDVPGHHVRASRRWIKVDVNPLHDSWKCFAKLSRLKHLGICHSPQILSRKPMRIMKWTRIEVKIEEPPGKKVPVLVGGF
jgi:hypothetical protein